MPTPHTASLTRIPTPHTFVFAGTIRRRRIDDHDREREERVGAMCCCSEADLWVEVSAKVKGVFFAKLALCVPIRLLVQFYCCFSAFCFRFSGQRGC